MMHPMRLRQVPLGSKQCFRFNFEEKKWYTDVPDLPLGKLYSTLISIENRYLYQIGGFDDYDYEIYCLDTYELSRNPEAQWMEIKLKSEIRLLKSYDFESSDSNVSDSEGFSDEDIASLPKNTSLEEKKKNKK